MIIHIDDQYTIDTQESSFSIIKLSKNIRHSTISDPIKTQLQDKNAKVWVLSCHSHRDGIWAGLDTFIESLRIDFQSQMPEIFAQHQDEIITVLPLLQKTTTSNRKTLTESATEIERVRNYAADRAFRTSQGLINMMDKIYSKLPSQHRVIICTQYEYASVLTKHFFSNLLRRKSEKLQLHIVFIHGESESSLDLLQTLPKNLAHQKISITREIKNHSDSDIEEEVNDQPQTKKYQFIQSTEFDPIEIQTTYPSIVHQMLVDGKDKEAFFHMLSLFAVYIKQGFYEDALLYGKRLLSILEQHFSENIENRWHVVSRLYFCYGGLRRANEVLHLLHEFVEKDTDRIYAYSMFYFLSMMYTRLLPERDFEKAEEYLEQGLSAIHTSNLPDDEKTFQTVFNRNGLALIRHFQGRSDEAVQLCQDGFKELNEKLPPGQHNLHRSVLIYNIGQVYATIGNIAEAIRYYSMVIEMDPYYSEYYNERGGLYLQSERFQEAIDDFQKGIELSSPYAEIWTNLGQCYRFMDRPEDAIAAYSVALDLEPATTLALVGRAEAFESLEQYQEALADYSAALLLRPNIARTWGNRAVVRYYLGQISEALDDINQAIQLDSSIPELFQNRAVALAQQGRFTEAAHDLQTYLDLSPDAEDRDEVQGQIQQYLTSVAVQQ